MEERRTLAYIDQDDIPSSAIAWDKTTNKSAVGNVVYARIPWQTAFIFGDGSNATITNYSYLNSSGFTANNNSSLSRYTKGLYLDDGELYTGIAINGVTNTALMNGYKRTYFYPCVIRAGSQTNDMDICEGDDLYGEYVKLKFDNPIFLYTDTTNSEPTDSASFYIDTES